MGKLSGSGSMCYSKEISQKIEQREAKQGRDSINGNRPLVLDAELNSLKKRGSGWWREWRSEVNNVLGTLVVVR